ncbi:N-acetylmuramoyl-L-alanine amidase [Streptomyces sp. TRM49041]|uniref:N-acetylmuramoyl-L-alanine amidase n=1 Tax=Streptomyces sp. TRM49041 TaxID=2603216 RepID=UPI0011EC422E|nr:N-acetylmuramoyl-L-alanine amidase [Streptomyces sp. TRM49041]
MATPLTPDKLLAALRAEGVTVVEHAGWRTNDRDHVGAWGPVNGVMIHHTVSSGTATSVQLCYDGYDQLPGPLCHGVIAKDGTVHLVGGGRANHAGGGDPAVLQRVIAEDYGDRPPAPHEHQGSPGAVDGNARFYGFECVNLGDGADPWPAAQLEAVERASAAICRAHGWTSKSVIGHLEWSDWKVDPRGFTMPAMRNRIATRLGTAATKPAPARTASPALRPPAIPAVDLSRLVAAARQDPPRAGTPVSYSGARVVEAALVAEGLLPKPYADGHFGTATVRAYAAWQRKLGYRGADADGIPGRTSLTRLGGRHGFTVTP